MFAGPLLLPFSVFFLLLLLLHLIAFSEISILSPSPHSVSVFHTEKKRSTVTSAVHVMSKETTSRWSDTRYTNMEVPSYIPPEAITHEKGQFLRALLLRVLAQDMQRMLETHTCDQYFRNIPIEPEYDASGNRTNTPENMIGEKRLHAIDDLSKLLRTYVERHDPSKSKDITRKLYFTQEQMDTGAWGSLIGARGAVHQQLEKETKCRVVLAGRGITNPLKDTNPNAAALALEDPHVRITAQNEQDLQAAAERIEWILSDDPEAVEFRDKNRRRMAQVEGRYDPRTWVSAADKKQAQAEKGGERGTAGKRPREEETVDAEVDEFLEDL